jgi:mycofactocin precursor
MLETTPTAVDTDHPDGTEPRDATPPAPPAAQRDSGQVLVQADLLVEDVSIDGMCGVY